MTDRTMTYDAERIISGAQIKSTALRGPGDVFEHAWAQAHSDLEGALGRSISVEETTVRMHVTIQVKTGGEQ